MHFITHDASYYNAFRFIGVDGNPQTEKMGRIVLKDNCFVGCNTVLLSGITVGENSVIAAGSVVNKSIPNNQVWGGVPAKYIMSMEEYSKKVVEQANLIPWIKGKYDNTSLQKARQDYYLNRYI